MHCLLHGGRFVENLQNLKDEDIVLESIAHSLAYQNRWNGHSSSPCSVAAHAVMVAVAVAKRHGAKAGFIALHHDSAEAYIGDVSSQIRPDNGMDFFNDLDTYVSGRIYKVYGISKSELVFYEPIVKKYDKMALYYELNSFFSDVPDHLFKEYKEYREIRNTDFNRFYLVSGGWKINPESDKNIFVLMHELFFYLMNLENGGKV